MISRLASKRFTLLLLIGLALVLIPESLGLSPSLIWVLRVLLAALSVNLLACTISQWRRLSSSVLVIHAGIIVILSGGLWGNLGFVATVNIHEGGSTATAFRWDRQQDIPLGFTLAVTRINREYYPTSIRIGIVTDGNPVELCELMTGESVHCAGLRVEALTIDPAGPKLTLAVTPPGGPTDEVVAATTLDSQKTGTVVQLVAFKTPALKRTWVDLTIIAAENGGLVKGQAEVNRPFIWKGLRFFHTASGSDPSGQPYAGIQIVRDQGIPLVYAGFALLVLGNILLLIKKWSFRQRGANAHNVPFLGPNEGGL